MPYGEWLRYNPVRRAGFDAEAVPSIERVKVSQLCSKEPVVEEGKRVEGDMGKNVMVDGIGRAKGSDEKSCRIGNGEVVVRDMEDDGRVGEGIVIREEGVARRVIKIKFIKGGVILVMLARCRVFDRAKNNIGPKLQLLLMELRRRVRITPAGYYETLMLELSWLRGLRWFVT